MEEWRNIEGYEGLYQISSRGRIRSLGNDKTRKTKILKPKKDRNGYLLVALCKDGKVKSYLIHRLVAEAFIPNPDNLPEVNHKNEVKTDNFVYVNLDGTINAEKSNLEWCDRKYNMNYGTAIQRSVEGIKKFYDRKGRKTEDMKKYYQEHKEHIREYQKTYYQENKEKFREYWNRWNQKNKEKRKKRA